MNYKWNEYQQFIKKDSLKIEEDNEDLKLYHFFDNLQWTWIYAVVLKDNILICSKEYPYTVFETAKDVYHIMTHF